MADSTGDRVPTATELYNAVRKIRTTKPGLGLKRVIVILRDEYGFTINKSRLRKLVAPGNGTNSKNDGSEIMAPTLSGVLGNADIRDRILTPLLTVSDQIYAHRWSKNFPGINLLHVNGEVRKAAWKFLLENNIWLGVRFIYDASETVRPLPTALFHTMNHVQHTQPTLVQANFVPELFTSDMVREFHSSVAVTMSIGHAQGRQQPVEDEEAKHQILPLFFAFHPRKYELFIRDLADTVEQWRCMTVDVNHAHIYKFPDTIPVVVDQIIRGLDNVREADRVASPSLQKDPIDLAVDFNTIARNMMSHREVRPKIRARLLELYDLGTKAMEDGEYREAVSVFRRAQGAYQTYHAKEGPKPKCGSIESNTIENINVDNLSMMAEGLNREVSARRTVSTGGHAGPHLLVRAMKATDMNLAVAAAEMALSWPGISDAQRIHAHSRRAVALANMGDYMTELSTVVPRADRAGVLADTQPIWHDAVFCYRCAAQDAFYACHAAAAAAAAADAPEELVAAMRALRARMCARAGQDADEHLAQMRRAGLARVLLPALGLWEGDPVVYAYLGPQRMMLMALFRQREDSGGAPTAAAANADLRHELAKLGLRWVHDRRGEVYLEGKAEARMSPVLVVPDDTRDGLRAAGLSGDRFEMARR